MQLFSGWVTFHSCCQGFLSLILQMKKSKKAKGKWPKSGQSTPISQSPPSVNYQPTASGTKFLQAGSKHNDQVTRNTSQMFLYPQYLTWSRFILDLLCFTVDLLHRSLNFQVAGGGFQPYCHQSTFQHWVRLGRQWRASRLSRLGQSVCIGRGPTGQCVRGHA